MAFSPGLFPRFSALVGEDAGGQGPIDKVSINIVYFHSLMQSHVDHARLHMPEQQPGNVNSFSANLTDN